MKAVIFDLDGTLIDSLEDIALSMNQVLKELGLEAHKICEYKNFVGDGALILVKNSLQHHCTPEIIDKALKRFIEVYETSVHDNTKAYPGIYELLEDLEKENYKMGILSNKPHKFTLEYANRLFPKNSFLEIHGQKNNIPKKPHPRAAIEISKAFDIPCEKTIFIGDTATDIKTAKAANMISIGVLWGFRTKEELELAKADYIVKEPKEIIEIIKNL